MKQLCFMQNAIAHAHLCKIMQMHVFYECLPCTFLHSVVRLSYSLTLKSLPVVKKFKT